MGEAVDRVVELWDGVINDFLDGRPTNVHPPLDRWFLGYAGRGLGQVDTSCFPEPYLGNLRGAPRAAILALNPGGSVSAFQSRDGIFAQEIREMGSYRSWAATWPYLRDPWGHNRHHAARMRFLSRWFGRGFSDDERVDFELYPWHSKRVTAFMRPDPGIIRDYIWAPLAELPVEFVFAFGARWLELIGHLPDVESVDRIGDGGRPYETTTKPGAKRAFLKASTPTGAWLIVGKHSGGATPPNEREVEVIRAEFGF